MNTLYDDHRRPLFPRGPGLGVRAFLLVVCAMVLIFKDFYGDGLHGLRSALSWTLTPVVWTAALPGRLLSAAGDLDSRGSLEQENARLRDRQLILDAQLQKMDALAAENRRIRELLASASQIRERVLIAEIVNINQDPYRHQITLDKGERDGVYRGQALIDAAGVMGQITEVSPRESKALLVTDPDHGIPVEINRTGLQTIAVGIGDGRGLRLPFLPSNVDIKVGDLLVSSALGNRFPAGYPVGEVYEVSHVAGEHFMEAFAQPAARLNRGRQALLVWIEQATEAPLVPQPAAAPSSPAAAPAGATAPAPGAAQ